MEISETLLERGGTYGKYTSVSQISQDLKKVMRESPNYKVMPALLQESLDISGYATLALMELEDMEIQSELDAS